jgi:hypothetical protein
MSKLSDLFIPDDRVRGFQFGYDNQFGPAKDFLTNPEFIKGWNEGASLRIDELRAQANAELRRGPLAKKDKEP